MSLRKVLMVTKPLTRNIHRSRPLQDDPRLKDLKKWQELFQTPDDVPLYLKRGLSDRILFGFIVIGTVAGLGNSLKYLYDEIIKP